MISIYVFFHHFVFIWFWIKQLQWSLPNKKQNWSFYVYFLGGKKECSIGNLKEKRFWAFFLQDIGYLSRGRKFIAGFNWRGHLKCSPDFFWGASTHTSSEEYRKPWFFNASTCVQHLFVSIVKACAALFVQYYEFFFSMWKVDQRGLPQNKERNWKRGSNICDSAWRR